METDTRDEQVEKAMIEAGVDPTDPVQVDYFGFEENHTVPLPDGKSFILHQTLNEGSRRQYLNNVNREVRLQKQSGDAILKMQTGEERHALLTSAIVGWDLVRKNDKTGEIEKVPFSAQNLKRFLDSANPKIVDVIEKDVRKHNPWLMQDVTVEDIDEQIAELEEMRADKVKEEEGKDS